MPLLYYWRGDNYRRDLDNGAGYHLNQRNPLLHQAELGDSIWAFTRRRDDSYVLAAELVVRAKTINPLGYHYGRYRIWGDLAQSRYFLLDGQPSIEPIIRILSCRAEAPVLGNAFQGGAAVRRMTASDHRLLVAAARYLPGEPRARILPEEKLEAALLLGGAEEVAALIREERPGIAEERVAYLSNVAPARDPRLVHSLQDRYLGQCQICAWNPQSVYGQYLCQGHHIQWLSRGGPDELDNLGLICPNHHAAVHRCDAPFDFGDLSFSFQDHRERLQTPGHLAA
jgi:5-methylcytosine-specific restriction protein A